MSEIRQYFTSVPGGWCFHDHFGPDFDAYIMQSYADSSYDFYEDPEFVEFTLDHMADGDFDLPEDHDENEILAIDLESVAGGIAILTKLGLEPIIIDDVDMTEDEFAAFMERELGRTSRA